MAYETLLAGLVLAVIYVEVFGVYPGGIIVPGYVALYLEEPQRIAATLLVAFLSLLVYKGISRYFILFGKRRFVLLVLIGAVLAEAWALALPSLFHEESALRAIGWLIPGLLANSLQRQRLLPTLAGLATVSVLTYFVVRLAGNLFGPAGP